MHRRDDFDEDLAKNLEDSEARKIFLLTLMEGEEGLNVVDALKQSIISIGLTEFSNLSNIPTSRISEFINEKKKPRLETLDKFLSPFCLKIKLDVEEAA